MMNKNYNDYFVRVTLTFAVLLLVPMHAASAHSTKVVAISAGLGNHTCAITSVRGAKCWGANEAGQLGNNDYGNSAIPVDVAGLASGVMAIANGDEFTCALTASGGVKCWGFNGNGQLGNPAFPDGSPAPVDVDGLAGDVVAIAAGAAHACALTAGGGVKCWGWNGGGQLGNPGFPDGSPTPVDVVGLSSGVTAIAAGYVHTCALLTNGGVKCWGFNGFGEFGDGSNNDSGTPVDAGLTSGVAAIAVGAYHTCGLSTQGVLKCWGLNLYGQIGGGSSAQIEFTPVEVIGLGQHVLAVTGGALHTCALTTGQDKCWGRNAYGQLGDATTTDRFTPVAIERLDGVAGAISGGQEHSCAITEDGGVKCWGWNYSGQLGNNSYTDSTRPVAVFGLGDK